MSSSVEPLQADPAPSPLEEDDWVYARPPRALEILGRVFRFPALLLAHRDLISTSVRRDLEVRFRGTLLGWLWPLVHPIFLFAVYYFIFTRLLGFKFGELPPEQASALGVFMFVGILVFSGFSESLIRGCNSIVDNGNLIKKLAFPSEILPLTVVLVNVVTMLFGVLVFIIASTVTPVWMMPGKGLLWIPVLLLLQVLFTFGLALFLSSMQVFLRDTLQIATILTTVWMFVTPLFWAPELIPGDTIDTWMPFITANPMYHLVQGWRICLMSGEPTMVLHGGVGQHLLSFLPWAAGAFLFGYSFFILCQRRFADEV